MIVSGIDDGVSKGHPRAGLGRYSWILCGAPVFVLGPIVLNDVNDANVQWPPHKPQMIA
jgi:hypothetical protein